MNRQKTVGDLGGRLLFVFLSSRHFPSSDGQNTDKTRILDLGSFRTVATLSSIEKE